ncbi:MAG: hypothetical protein HY054_08385 [Proteobacteria bacterium]|nr:hypothetical protein [Pseudomonadota bacterium]
MVDREGDGSGWLGFIAGVVVVALIGVAIYTYADAGHPRQQAQIELNVHDVKLNPPDIHPPSPPPEPSVPRAANDGA